LVRGQRAILDEDLAALYGVKTKQLNLAVTRNRVRFPDDFMFVLRSDEARNLRFQIETSRSIGRGSKATWGGRRSAPRAFTEQGVAMLSGVLRSERAVLVNIEIMRAFVRLRAMIAANAELGRKLDALERRYDTQFKLVFEAIRELMAPPAPKRRSIGFTSTP
jgi:hypothetical protein